MSFELNWIEFDAGGSAELQYFFYSHKYIRTKDDRYTLDGGNAVCNVNARTAVVENCCALAKILAKICLLRNLDELENIEGFLFLTGCKTGTTFADISDFILFIFLL